MERSWLMIFNFLYDGMLWREGVGGGCLCQVPMQKLVCSPESNYFAWKWSQNYRNKMLFAYPYIRWQLTPINNNNNKAHTYWIRLVCVLYIHMTSTLTTMRFSNRTLKLSSKFRRKKDSTSKKRLHQNIHTLRLCVCTGDNLHISCGGVFLSNEARWRKHNEKKRVKNNKTGND